MVTGFEDITTGLTLPDPKDCHVLAAAIECGAQVIVTYNLRDFPKDALAPHNIEARHPDDFLLETMDIYEGKVLAAVAAMAGRCQNPPRSATEIGDLLRKSVPQAAARIVSALDG